ncbi:hypothetical protein FSARC_10558 [Fusarium sarcochroum]|uniref:Kynurenine formamidase n=1 Tax=Fusarium sarcochroum TaxID=1208366 RepID=A0A8H4X307_9HYPO|nr:hypothetical protein FSARC_10558 [Fusarium sarcochroum]
MSSTESDSPQGVTWQALEVKSPHVNKPVLVYAAKSIPYVQGAHRFQSINVYAPRSPNSTISPGQPFNSLPSSDGSTSELPRWLVHIHGGAWRDPFLDASSIEATVAHAFESVGSDSPISAIISINYTLSPFPTHPTHQYDPNNGDQLDTARNAQHPGHIKDVLDAFALLQILGLKDDSYILSGHSAGACLAFQAALFTREQLGLGPGGLPPRPAAVVGLNGLYDLPDLVHNLGASHQHLAEVYQNLLGQAFGQDQDAWPTASPARFDPKSVAQRLEEGKLARVTLIDQSIEDQLVPVAQADKLERRLREVKGLRVIRGNRCTDRHATPWEEGYMIWQTVEDVLGVLSDGA